MRFARHFPLMMLLAAHAPAQDVITNAVELHSLTRAEMISPRKVKLRGVVTYKRGDEFSDFAMQDGTGGLIADGQIHVPQIRGVEIGQEILIEGYTVIVPAPAPRVSVTSFTPGPMVGLPEPMPLTPQALLGGAGLFSYVEFSAVIRNTRIEKELVPHRLVLEFGPPQQRFSVRLASYGEETLGMLKPDARVKVRGTALAWTSVNLLPYSVFIGVSHPSQIELLSAAVDPEEAEPEPLDRLISTPAEGFDARRQKIQGTVTLNWPGKLVVMQGRNGAIRLNPAGSPELVPGDRVWASGFASADSGRIYLDEAVFGKTGSGSPPQPQEADATLITPEASIEDRENHLLRVVAELKEITTRQGQPLLRMSEGDSHFDALLPESAKLPETIRPGSRLELTGVCRIIISENARRQAIRVDGYEILLNSPADIRMISAAPWWTLRRLAIATAIVFAGFGLSLLWVAALRKRVAVRSALLVREIRARHDNQLLVSERSRLAADLHDTLSQTLSGAAFQMEIAHSLGNVPETEGHYGLARRLLDRSREDLRRAVWDLTPTAMVERDLGDALRETAAELAADSGCSVSVEVGEGLPAIPRRIGSHLFRVGQEAMHNAIHHGHPSRVFVSLSHDDHAVMLQVADDGKGFDASRAPGPTQGHFGLTSMRDRIKRLGGDYNITSGKGGTTLTATVPITQEP